VHGCDLGDPLLVRTLVVDAIRSGVPHPDWSYRLTARGEPRDPATRRLVARWAADWRAAGARSGPGPVLRVGATAPLHGTAALAWLGAELRRRGVDPVPSTAAAHPPCCADLDDRLAPAG